jgi:hypothetical protein
MDTLFLRNFSAMVAGCRAAYKRKVAALLAPDLNVEAARHTGNVTKCSCRVCYWARGLPHTIAFTDPGLTTKTVSAESFEAAQRIIETEPKYSSATIYCQETPYCQEAFIAFGNREVGESTWAIQARQFQTI